MLLLSTINPQHNQELIRFFFIWTFVSIQKDIGDLLCPSTEETEILMLNQPFKSLEKTIAGFCFLKDDLLNGEVEMRENQPQFDSK